MDSSNIDDISVPECIICQDIFYQPITLSCGHSYCRQCIKEGLKVKPLCPTCRNPMIGNPDNLSINFTLQNIIETNYKARYEEKKKSVERKFGIDFLTNPASTASSSRIQNDSNIQQTEKKIDNMLILQQYKMKYLFPYTTVNVYLKYQDQLDKLLLQCSDKRVIIQFAKSDQILAAQCQINEIFGLELLNQKSKFIKCEVKVISRVEIININDVKINYNESIVQNQRQQQHEESKNNETNQNQSLNEGQNQIINEQNQQNNQQENTINNNVQENKRLFNDGYTFKVASCNIIEDRNVNGEQETGIQEYTEEILRMIDHIITNNGGLSMNSIELSQLLLKQNFITFLSSGYIDNMNKVQEFSWIVCGLFNFNLNEKERLWNAESLIERLTLLKQYLHKFDKISNITSVFDIEAPGHHDNITLIIFAGIIIFILLKYFKIIG